jgi:uncharacterized protein (UPF0332 family)
VKAKARENLEAALRLLDLGLLNAAASRLYYGAFQAAIHALDEKRRTPLESRRGARGWSHEKVEEHVAEIRGEREDRALFDDSRSLRETADYGPSSVTRQDLDHLRHDAERFIRQLTS